MLSTDGRQVLEQLDKTWQELAFAVQTSIEGRK
jgi:PadR family transcriptional regulator PadR